MKKSKKINPRRRPATQADVQKAKEQAQVAGVKAASAIMMFVMREKFGWGEKRLTRLWNEVESLSEDVISGEVKLDEIIEVLLDEYGIDVK